MKEKEILKIGNKWSKDKRKNTKKIFSKIVKIYKFFRLKFIKIIPLSKDEKINFKEETLNIENSKLIQGEFFEIETIDLLVAFEKAKFLNLYKGLERILFDNPLLNRIPIFFTKEELEKAIFSYNNFDNYSNCFYIGSFKPIDNKLVDIINKVEIISFNLSNDYIGLSFKMDLTKEIKEYINNIIKNDVLEEEEYKIYKLNKKITLRKNLKNNDLIRKEKVNNILIEIKSRMYEFINKYIDLIPLKEKCPISFDIYSTNLSLDNNSRFLLSYDIMGVKEERFDDFPIKDHLNNVLKSKFIFECRNLRFNKNRSARGILYKKDKTQKVIYSQFDIENIYILILYFYYLDDLESILINERNNLLNLSESNAKKNYKIFVKNSINISYFKNIFKGTRYLKYSYLPKDLKKCFKSQKNRYKNLLIKHKELELEYNSKITMSNYISSYELSKTAISIAVGAIVISIITSITIYNLDKTKYNMDDLYNLINNSNVEFFKTFYNIENKLENIGENKSDIIKER